MTTEKFHEHIHPRTHDRSSKRRQSLRKNWEIFFRIVERLVYDLTEIFTPNDLNSRELVNWAREMNYEHYRKLQINEGWVEA